MQFAQYQTDAVLKAAAEVAVAERLRKHLAETQVTYLLTHKLLQLLWRLGSAESCSVALLPGCCTVEHYML